MKSAIFRGWVRHRRRTPVNHEFRYPLFMMYLDLGELDRVFRGRWLWSATRPNLAWFKRADHLGDPETSLEGSVRDLVQERTGRRPVGPVRLLTHLRYFGYCFNPASFYYCFDESGTRVETVVAEVNNTPWGERHCYVMARGGEGDSGRAMRFRTSKELHVSPFMVMDQDYLWAVTEPSESLVVQIENHEGGERIFDATLSLRRREIGARSLASVLLRYPWMTAQVILAIHWQALRLWLKKVPFRAHPRALRVEEERT
jgi:DUF1365 family protein